MKLSLQTDYSLRTLMYLAMSPGRQRVEDISTFFQISTGHVAKVVNQLARLGYVRSIRGIGGGLELGKPPSMITIGEIVRAVEGTVHLLECLGMEDICVIQRHCKLRTVLNQAEKIQMDYLNSVTLADVLPFQPVPTSTNSRSSQAVVISQPDRSSESPKTNQEPRHSPKAVEKSVKSQRQTERKVKK